MLIAYQPLLTTTTGLLWDDAGHITSPGLRSLHGLWRIWFDLGATQQYYPVVHSAFWLEARLWGNWLAGYHAVNVLLHAGSAFLLILILRRLRVPAAVLAGLLFALHPVQAETVAWISELKNTLSCIFFLASALVFLRYDDTRGRGAYGTAILLYACAVLSKSVTATLPVALLVVLWYRHGRIEWRRHVVPLLPFLAMGIGLGGLTAWFEQAVIGAEGDDFRLGSIERTLIAGRAIVFYVTSLFWPGNLSFNYPRWTVSAASWWQYLFPAGVAVALGSFWRMRWRGTVTAILIYSITLAPALGFVNVYPFRFSFVADHFQYHASMAAFALIAAGLAALCARLQANRTMFRLVSAVVVVLLLIATRGQAAHYTDEATLYRATLESNPRSWFAHGNLSAMLVTGSSAEVREGEAHAREALRLKPDHLQARYALGIALELQQRFDDAVAEYRQALDGSVAARVAPGRIAAIRRHLGISLRERGEVDTAIAELQQSVALDPGNALGHSELGMTYARSGRPDAALPHFQQAARLAPDSANHRSNLGSALLQLGRPAEAVESFSDAVRLDPAMADAFHNLGAAYVALGRYQEAASAFREAVRLRPSDERSQAALAEV